MVILSASEELISNYYKMWPKLTCSAQLMHVGSNGITGNIYSKGYIKVIKAITDIDNAL